MLGLLNTEASRSVIVGLQHNHQKHGMTKSEVQSKKRKLSQQGHSL